MRVDLFLGADVVPEIRVIARVDALGPKAALPFEIRQRRDVRLDPPRRIGLEAHHQWGDGNIGREFHVHVKVIEPTPDFDGPAFSSLHDPGKHGYHPQPNIRSQPGPPVLGGPYDMHSNAHHASRHRLLQIPLPYLAPIQLHHPLHPPPHHSTPTDPRDRRVRGGRKPAPRWTPAPRCTTGPSFRTGPRLLRPRRGLPASRPIGSLRV